MLAKIYLDHGKHNIVMVEGIILCNASNCLPRYEKVGVSQYFVDHDGCSYMGIYTYRR